jgi:hydroxyethylthiazole kinase-like uncharacterized protein yjeF
MLVSKACQMREIDRRTIEKYQIPGILLMEEAAAGIYEHIKKLNFKNILVVCGGGNNGGDGFAAARLLIANGYNVDVFCFTDAEKIKGDAKINYNILLNMNIPVQNDIKILEIKSKTYDVVIDAIFGTGISGEIRGIYKDVIEILNNNSNYIVSVDIPSGIDSDNGLCCGNHINANDTVTFVSKKYGHLLNEGRTASGSVFVRNITTPKKCIEEQNIKTMTNDENYPSCLLRKRKVDSNKGDYGKVYIIGGSYRMSGAAALAASAALRCGAGLVNCVIPASITERIGSLVPEVTFTPCSEIDGTLNISESELDEVINKADVIAFGTGITTYEHLKDTLLYIIKNSKKPLVIDADGLNILSSIKYCLNGRENKIAITPHPGEMSRLTGYSIDYINEHRVDVAVEFAKHYNCNVLLKGSSTVVTDGEKIYINTTGNPGMAKGGSGDVLTGMTAAFIGQGYDMFNSLVLSSYFHGLAGNATYDIQGYGLCASDIVNSIGRVIKL